MTKRIYTDPTIASSDITPESVFLNRRTLIKATAAATASGIALGSNQASAEPSGSDEGGGRVLRFKPDGDLSLKDEQTPYEAVTTYNNFYEFGTDKSDPARHAHSMTTNPWSVKVGGLVGQPGELHLEDVLTGFDLEERIYRFRCVAACASLAESTASVASPRSKASASSASARSCKLATAPASAASSIRACHACAPGKGLRASGR